MAKLARAIETARFDYRDVLIQAEYPINYRFTEEYDESIRQDWKNYNDWLAR